MTHKRRLRNVIQYMLYCILGAGILWQSYNVYALTRKPLHLENVPSFHVRINGNVRRPGVYRVVEGTTQFEILKVAGIRLTSDLSQFNLFGQIEENADVEVGTLEQPVNIGQKVMTAQLEFFFGELNVIASDGRSLPQHGGLTINPGDRILTEEASQAEISIGDYSRIDIDNFSELIFDKIGVQENDRTLVELFQKSGGVWYKIVYGKNEELFRVLTPNTILNIGGSGADFFVNIQHDQVTIDLMDGLVLVERTDGSESINLITGQSVTIFNDGRPFQITKLILDVNPNELFSQLSREKMNYMSRFMPLNILVCGTPSIFYLVNVNYERSEINTVPVPPELLIEQFAQDIETLGQAYLYGGPVFVSTFIERILNLKTHKHIVIDKDNIVRIGTAIGGLNAIIDEKASSTLNLSLGKHKLVGRNLLLYLSPGSSGIEVSRARQANLLKNLFEDLQSKTLVPTLLLSEQLINNTETNFTANDIMEQYVKFSGKSNWTYREHTLPASITRRNNRVTYEPDLAKCKSLFNQSER